MNHEEREARIRVWKVVGNIALLLIIMAIVYAIFS